MTDYKKLVEALRYCAESGDFKCGKDCPMHTEYPNCLTKMDTDAADAIEKLVTLYEKAEIDATNLTGKLTQAEAQLTDFAAAIEELKDKPWVESVQIDKLRQRIDELEEKQTYCDAYGDKWMTSGKDVPTEAYKHGYADGWDKAMAKMEEQLPKRCEIVRCRECKWYDPLDRTRPFFCPVMDCATGVMEDDFCSRGERRAKMEAQDG